ncbi:MAG: hypothetical protein C4522_07395, partial [Desulfobacteraceae bacterium]
MELSNHCGRIKPLSDILWEDCNVIDMLMSPLTELLLNLVRQERNKKKIKHGMVNSRSFISKVKLKYDMLKNNHRSKKITSAPEKASVIFWPCEPTHLQSQIPVAKELLKRNISCAFLTNRPSLVPKIVKLDCKAIYAGFLWEKEIRRAKKKARTQTERFADLGFGFPDFMIPYDPEKLSQLISGHIRMMLPFMVETAAIFREAVNTITPSLMIIGNDLTYEGRIVSTLSKTKKLPTVSIMHGVVDGNPLHYHHIVDLFLVHGQKAKKIIERSSKNNTKISICGAPHLDHITRNRQINPKIKDAVNINHNDRYCLVATSGPGNSISYNHHLEVIQSIFTASKRFHNVHFVIKLHRKDQVEFYENMRSRKNITIIEHSHNRLP